MKIGIDKIGFYTPNKYVDMVDLAMARNVDPNKYLKGIGQEKMSVADISQDAVSMAINATKQYLPKIDIDKVGLLIVGTESSVDESKSASLFVKSALKLKASVRTFEIKEACFGLTAAIFTAYDYISTHSDKTAIVIGSDIARYGLNTAGEVTQGAGSISLLIKKDPAMLSINPQTSAYSKDINDFWRPTGSATALVDGKYSTQVYLDFFEYTFKNYQKQNHVDISNFKALLYHLPFTKMGLKANNLAIANLAERDAKKLTNEFKNSIELSKQVGNIYTGSLYLGLLSLLVHAELKLNDLIGLFSYGSGAMAEFFTFNIEAGYRNEIIDPYLILNRRKRLTVAEYENIFTESLQAPIDGQSLVSDEQAGMWYFAGTKNHIRQYCEKNR